MLYFISSLLSFSSFLLSFLILETVMFIFLSLNLNIKFLNSKLVAIDTPVFSINNELLEILKYKL